MAKATNETVNPVNETETEEDESMSFEERVKLVLGNVEKEAEATAERPAILKWKEGVTLDTLQKELGYKKKTSLTVGLGTIRDFLKAESMVVHYKDADLKGQQLRQRLSLARGKFIDYVKENTKPGVAAPAFKVVKEGIELPQFRTRNTEVPDALAIMEDLLGEIG